MKPRRVLILFTLAALCLVPSNAQAIENAVQLISGGNSQPQGGTSYTAPGMANQYTLDFPGTGDGKDAGSIRMPAAGTVTKLRVLLRTTTTPSGGSFTLTVLKNSVATNLACTLAGEGICNSNASVALGNNDRLGIEVKNNFTNSGNIAYTYTMLLD